MTQCSKLPVTFKKVLQKNYKILDDKNMNFLRTTDIAARVPNLNDMQITKWV